MSCDDHVIPAQVGNCVAKRNYRYFYLFLNTVMVMAIYVMGCNIAVIVLGKLHVYMSMCTSRELVSSCSVTYESYSIESTFAVTNYSM